MKHVSFAGRLVMLGCGSIGQGVLPLILRHIDMPRERIHILTADARGSDVAAEFGVALTVAPVTRDNYRDLLAPLLGRGDFLLNLSVDVSSVALIALCQELGALYLDTCIEPWAGGYTDPSLTPSQRSNYALRESALALARPGDKGPTAVLTHGANPGLVSHFVKQALLDIARDTGADQVVPVIAGGLGGAGGAPWREGDPHRRARHAVGRYRQGARASSSTPGRSTASPAKAASPPSSAGARMSAGRRRMRADTNSAATRRSICCGRVRRRGCARWTPLEGPFHGFLVTHNEFDLDRRLPDAARGRRGALPADGALRLPPVRRRGAVAARVRRQELAAAGTEATDDARDRPRHGRAWACC